MMIVSIVSIVLSIGVVVVGWRRVSGGVEAGGSNVTIEANMPVMRGVRPFPLAGLKIRHT